ncbi:MAG: 4-aminobutyrate--2-oxoglutarate transaminase [Candidatus Riflebacteria bacterium]|nr:4-aminobutyrate--2-oxoglutarate transaminase [Candidatus Riflebacteria bacterium]
MATRRDIVKLDTPIPGPRSRELFARRERAVPRGPFHVAPIFIDHGEGARVTDVDGNVYLDFAGGIGCLNVGHAHPRLVKRVQEQAARYFHSCFHVLPNEPYVALAERLNELAPGRFPRKTLLVNSGAEAVENAVKIARAATGRPAVVCFEDGFHGRTLLTLTLTSKVNPYKVGFGPFAPEAYRVPYAYCYRCSYDLEPATCNVACGDALENLFSRHVDARTVACVVVEPILGEGGFVVPPAPFFQKLRACCDRHGILLIADEVQTGMGRTGALFACERLGLEPDLVTSAKSLAGGLPLAAVTGRAEIMDQPVVGGLGGTYGGNPLAATAALEVLGLLVEGKLVERATVIERAFRERAGRIRERSPLVGDIRGMGAMMAIELVKDRTSRHPAKEETGRVTRGAYERGLITISAGTFGNVIRTLMPLVITDEELTVGLDILEEAILAQGNGR